MTTGTRHTTEWRVGRLTLAGLGVIAMTFGCGGYWAATATLAGAVVASAE